MRTLAEELPGRIARLEAEFGSDNPFVQDLKKQLRDLTESKDQKPTEERYYLSAAPTPAAKKRESQ